VQVELNLITLQRGYWALPSNQRLYFDWLGEILDIRDASDWYTLKKEDIVKRGGHSLLAYHYSHSPSRALSSIYPHTTWHHWKFHQTPVKNICFLFVFTDSKKGHFWDSYQNCRSYMEWLGDELKVDKYEDWYKVRYQCWDN
jgi:hypothetical protein